MPATTRSIFSRVHALTILVFVLLIPGVLGSLPILSSFLFVLPILPKLHRRFIAAIETFWFMYISFVLERVVGIDYRITSSDPNVLNIKDGESLLSTNRPVVLVSNHLCRLDWMYLWPVVARLGLIPGFRILLANHLLRYPVLSFFMRSFFFIFLSRKADVDGPHIRSRLTLLQELNEPIALLVFPEGTDRSESMVARSNKWALEQTPPAPEYKYVLHPRTTGLKIISSTLPNAVVINLSIAYEAGAGKALDRFNELDLIRGNFPRKVHVRIERSGPLESFDVAAEWAKKEKEIAEFEMASVAAVAAEAAAPAGALVSGPRLHGEVLDFPTHTAASYQTAALWFWFVLPSLMCAYGSWWWFGGLLAFNIGLTALKSGVDDVEAWLHVIRGPPPPTASRRD